MVMFFHTIIKQICIQKCRSAHNINYIYLVPFMIFFGSIVIIYMGLEMNLIYSKCLFGPIYAFLWAHNLLYLALILNLFGPKLNLFGQEFEIGFWSQICAIFAFLWALHLSS